MYLPWSRPSRWRPRRIFMQHMGVRMKLEQAAVEVDAVEVVVVVVDAGGNWGWSMRVPNRILWRSSAKRKSWQSFRRRAVRRQRRSNNWKKQKRRPGPARAISVRKRAISSGIVLTWKSSGR